MRIFFGITQEEITTVELMDATDPGEHNGNIIADPETGVDSRIIPLDDSTSQANVSITSLRSWKEEIGQKNFREMYKEKDSLQKLSL